MRDDHCPTCKGLYLRPAQKNLLVIKWTFRELAHKLNRSCWRITDWAKKA